MQLHGGSTTSSVRDQLDQLGVKPTVRLLSVFDCEMDLPDQVFEDSLCAVLNNVLSRGSPTLCSPYVEQTLVKCLQLARERTSSGSIKFDFAAAPNDEMNDLLRRALVIIDPRLEPAEILANRCDSEKEREFLHSILPNIVGAYASQLLELQRPLDSIAKGDRFQEQRVDFACEFPGKTNRTRGLVIEIDGAPHDEEPQASLDKQRDNAVCAAGWQTVRIKTREFPSIPVEKIDQLKSFFQNEYANMAAYNHEEPFWENELARRVFQLVLVPLAVARIQKTLVRLVHNGVLSLEASQWRIAVHERDVPCAWLAIEDFLQFLSNLLGLQGRTFDPKVELRAYCSKEFAEAELGEPDRNLSFDYRREVAGFRGELSDGLEAFDADMFLDIAILQRSGLTAVEPSFKDHIAPNAVTAVIRSVHHIDAPRRVTIAEPVTYQLDSEEKRESLCYFLQYLFRKEEFWEGQLDILERALARENVIGLLPTGAGKSLCYQLSALLQPGITLVIDPIKSLMHDQDDHLKEAGIDTTTFVDSSLKGDEKTRRIKRFQDGQFQFTFITPERLMIKEFRNALTKMRAGASPKWFTYCVIDEAHCVSEWGHDFRTAYLRLGENARRFCKPASGDLPFIALTGTASFDVLSDIQRELQLEDKDAIVSLESYQREELHFEVITVQKPQDLPASKEKDWKPAAKQKELYLVNWLRKLPQQFGYQSDENGDFYERNGERTNSGLIFCPHVNYVFGIHKVTTYLKENLPQIAERIGKYAGKLDPVYLEKTQRGFRNNDLALLVATKSFGMGIDKPNIRYTLHFNMPPSLEAFYQEAGRAGRDRQKAICTLLFSEKFSDKGLMQSFIKDAFQGEDKEKRLVYELLNNIEWSQRSHAGIEKIIDTMTVNQTQKVLIPFENGRIKTIARYTHRDEEKVHDAYKWRYNVKDFAGKLRVPVAAQLTSDFERIRTESETFKAIYRLSVVGVIKDYTIDYNAHLIEAIVRKQPDDKYIEMLTTYVSRYMSREEAKKVPDAIR
ncbi:RecQ family ATP-dependent DNA helicase, partial [Candidatus Bipolaricaulota bacterium]|nr:RecQ family ATP-dependent DNA helicase [Candidatus Bipolaricaulota bacterium]